MTEKEEEEEAAHPLRLPPPQRGLSALGSEEIRKMEEEPARLFRPLPPTRRRGPRLPLAGAVTMQRTPPSRPNGCHRRGGTVSAHGGGERCGLRLGCPPPQGRGRRRRRPCDGCCRCCWVSCRHPRRRRGLPPRMRLVVIHRKARRLMLPPPPLLVLPLLPPELLPWAPASAPTSSSCWASPARPGLSEPEKLGMRQEAPLLVPEARVGKPGLPAQASRR